MSKGERRFHLVAVYLLIMILFFLPYSKFKYYVSGWGIDMPALPKSMVLIGENGDFGLLMDQVKDKGFIALPLLIKDIAEYRKFMRWKEVASKKERKVVIPSKEQMEYLFPGEELKKKLQDYSRELIAMELQTEFIDLYDGEFIFHKIRIPSLITEIFVLMVSWLFVYLLFFRISKKRGD